MALFRKFQAYRMELARTTDLDRILELTLKSIEYFLLQEVLLHHFQQQTILGFLGDFGSRGRILYQ